MGTEQEGGSGVKPSKKGRRGEGKGGRREGRKKSGVGEEKVRGNEENQ